MKEKNWIWIVCIAIFGSGLYVQSISFDYTLDDGLFIISNRITTKGMEEWTELFKYGSMNFIEISPVNSGIYRPFTLLTFALENELVGKFNPIVSHSINLILYFSLLIILGWILVFLIQKRSLPWWVGGLTLFLFAVHPVHVEVVASAKSRDTLLSALFAFSAILIWVQNYKNLKAGHWIALLSLYFLSLLSKEESIPLIALVGLIAYFFLGKTPWEAAKSTLPFAAVALVYLLIRGLILDSASTAYDSYVNSVMYMANGSERLATNFYIYLQYLKLLIFPHPLSWDYSFSQLTVQNFQSMQVWLSIFIFGAVIYFAVKGFKERNLFSFGIIFYLATFSIFSNIVPALIIGSNLGERFLFVPSLAFSFLVVYLLFVLSKRLPGKWANLFPILLLIPVLLGFSWKTFDRTKVWKNNFTITKNDVKSAPKSWRTHAFYADELRKLGLEMKKDQPDSARNNFLEAKMEYEIMLGILGNDMPVSQYLSAYAEVLILLGDSTKAISTLETAIEKNPRSFYPLVQLGRFNFDKGNYSEAEIFYLKALQADKASLGPLYRNLGLTYSRMFQKEKAVVALEKSLQYSEDPEIKKVLGFLYSELGQTEKASQYLISDEVSTPEEIQFISALIKGNSAFEKKDYKTALGEYLKIEPVYDQVDGQSKFPSFFSAFGKTLLETGDTTGAKINFLKAVEKMKSQDPVVYTNLGTIAFLKDKNFSLAENYYKKAIEYGVEDKFSGYSNLGMTQLAQKKEKEASLTFEKALEFGSSRSVIGNLY
ncbi:lipopolysaccharide assembly protein LapB, partial [Algoriphagus sp.]